MGQGRVLGGGAGGPAQRQVGQHSAGSDLGAVETGGHDHRRARAWEEGKGGAWAAIGARVARPEGIVAFLI
jgi:hypothetical protein